MPPKVWFVTGCSSGFGAAFVKEILATGDRVVATARNVADLESLRRAGAECLELDITSSPQEIDNIVASAQSKFGPVDVLINNASYTQLGSVEETSNESLRAQFDTTLFGTINITKTFLPFFRQRRSGTIVMITSVDAQVGRAGFGPYTASKHALHGITECLREDVRPFNVRVITVAPGTFRTSAITPRNLKIAPASDSDYRPLEEESNSLYGIHGSEPGDPSKMVRLVVQLVNLEGYFEGHKDLTYLPVGLDAWNELRENHQSKLNILNMHRSLICSTDFDQIVDK